MRKNPGEVITRYHITRLISKAYMRALTPENFASSFRKTGIFPLNKDAVKTENFRPAEILMQTINTSHKSSSKCSDGAESSLATFLPHPSPSATTKPKRKIQYRPGGITEEKILLKYEKCTTNRKNLQCQRPTRKENQDIVALCKANNIKTEM
ncbi:hypothetical protein HOLleu_00680 [Holothuria leucospilota]|uniref:Uncharacterized protein n=1 Tax=Holothuria leucospilota TaxID=206669 RepID=A0A9Q1HIU3_HOLLE|nr:hypothetical protein HOLleu_00680 [Holothuria leucospilota]